MKVAIHRPSQQGAATLVVVMMLCIVMALLAAYANRSLLFEQRMAGGYSRAGMAKEMGEASLGWTLALMNGPAVDQQCLPADAPQGSRFVDRYLAISAADRGIGTAGVSVDTELKADCTRVDDGWVCRCDAPGARARPDPIAGEGLNPSFGVRFSTLNARAGTIQVVGTGCTDSVVDNCVHNIANSSRTQLGASLPQTVVALVSAVRSPPPAPLVAKGDLNSSGDGLGLHNTDPRTAGMLYVIGGKPGAGVKDDRMASLPGTPVEAARVNEDKVLSDAKADLFRMFMGMTAQRYVNHPALHVVDCSNDCDTKLLAAYKSGWRMLWVGNAVTFGNGAVLGSESDPVVVIADGPVTLNGGFHLTGLLVARGSLLWTNSTASSSLITGAVLVEGDVTTSGRMDIHYRQAVSDQLRNRLGSYVPVPGAWSDSR